MGHMHQARLSTAYLLEYYPEEGVPSSATIQIVNDAGSDLLAQTGTGVSVDSYSQSITTGTRGATSITPADTTGLTVGTRYWATDAGGRGIELEALSISGGVVEVNKQLPFSLTGGSLDGLKISYTISSSLTGTLRRCFRIVWRYTANGVAVVNEDDLLDVVRVPFAIPVRMADVERVDPQFGSRGGSEYLRLRERVVGDIASELSSRGVYPDTVIDRRLLVPAAVYGLLALRHIRDEVLFERYRGLADSSMSRFFESKSWVDIDEDGARAVASTTSTAGVATWPGGGSSGYDESTPPLDYMRVS